MRIFLKTSGKIRIFWGFFWYTGKQENKTSIDSHSILSLSCLNKQKKEHNLFCDYVSIINVNYTRQQIYRANEVCIRASLPECYAVPSDGSKSLILVIPSGRYRKASFKAQLKCNFLIRSFSKNILESPSKTLLSNSSFVAFITIAIQSLVGQLISNCLLCQNIKSMRSGAMYILFKMQHLSVSGTEKTLSKQVLMKGKNQVFFFNQVKSSCLQTEPYTILCFLIFSKTIR